MLGYVTGALAPHAIPVVSGLEGAAPSRDDLKAYAAAFATLSAAPMFHIAGVTPEAQDPIATAEWLALPTHKIGRPELRAAWAAFNVGGPSAVSAIAIGSPHASHDELAALARYCDGRQKAPTVAAIITTGRAVYDQAKASGMVERLERFGFTFVTDTCWCMLGRPIVPRSPGAVLTNSGKYAHYGPGLIGHPVLFAGHRQLVDAAMCGHFDAAQPCWLD